ncbi:MAG: SprT-like domain-containing protein [Flavobacteriales bacterium]|nr:SprT-like domain-containing protein [Flavobacteriales bacterium]
MKNSTNIEKGLAPFLPAEALNYVCQLLHENPCHLHIKPPRSSKLGDFRAPHGNRRAEITVNGDLNKYAFTITLIHELAHLRTWNAHQNKVKPHGSEWKNEFRKLLLPLFELHTFPENVERALASYLKNPAASSCTDIHLQKALKNYDRGEQLPMVDELPVNSLFVYQNRRLFKKLGKVRKRIRCEEVKTGKIYLFSPIAEVKLFHQSPVENPVS